MNRTKVGEQTMDRKKINEKIKALRLAQNMTQNDVAEKSGLSKMSYQRYERGELEPKFSKAIRIAEVLNTAPQAIWGNQ